MPANEKQDQPSDTFKKDIYALFYMKYATSEKNGSRGTLGNQYLRFGTLKLDINAGERRGEPKNCVFANKKGPKQCLGFK